MKKPINIGLIGWGPVGDGVVRILTESRRYLAEQVGRPLNLKSVVDLDLRKKRSSKPPGAAYSKDASFILDDKEIDIVVELIGGVRPAKSYIERAIRNGKSVVTANKALLAEHSGDIFLLAAKHNREIGFEASVCGGIPLIKSIRQGLAANKISSLRGIINGTANFILTQMEEGNMSFAAAVKKARELGFAEADSSLDTSGLDSAHKLAILASLIFGGPVQLRDIYVEGIENITPADIRYAAELGYVIKLLAIAREGSGRTEARVHPVLLAKDNLLSSVNHVYNAVYLKADKAGEVIFYGPGAGKMPTASAVISDICELGKNLVFSPSGKVDPVFRRREVIPIGNIENIKLRYYLRFTTLDAPGVLAGISRVLGKRGISISSCFQKERGEGKTVPIVMMTHRARERDMKAALKEIDRLKVVKGKTVAIRGEG